MKLYCYLQIKPLNQIEFTSKSSDDFRKLDYLIFEADNHSNAFLMQQGKQLIQEALEIFIEIDADPQEDLGKLNLIFESLRKSQIRTEYHLKGKHNTLEKMLKFIKAHQVESVHSHLISKGSASK